MAKAKVQDAQENLGVGRLEVTATSLIETYGVLVSQTEELVVIQVARKRRSPENVTLPLASVDQLIIDGDGNASAYSTGTLLDVYEGVTCTSMEGQYFMGSNEDGLQFLIKPGLWKFFTEPEGEEAPTKTKAGKKPAAKPADDADDDEPPAKGKAKAGKKPAAKVEAADPEPDEGDEEEFEPEVGQLVTINFEDEDTESVTGTVDAISPRIITVDGEKYKRAEISSIEAAESDEPEFEPEVGSYVTVTSGDEEVTGEVTALTEKKITVTDEDGEERVFTLSKSEVVEAERPKKAKGKKPAKPAAEEADDEPPAKGKAGKKPAKPAEEDADDDKSW